MTSLAAVEGQELLARLHSLVRRGNDVEAELIAYLGEVDARRLYLEQACSSMFVYCRDVLHFAEGVAYKRIQVARAARNHPAVLEALRRGELHLSGASLLAPKLTSQNCDELLRAARNRSVDEIKRLLADREPKPEVPATVRRQPRHRGDGREDALPAAPKPSVAGKPSARPAPAQPEPVARARTEALGDERYCIRFTADSEVHGQLQELRALMRHQVPDGDVGKILTRAVALLLGHVRKRKIGECKAARIPKATAESPSRHIPAQVRRTVWERDGGRCTYVSATGRRCDARAWLEFDHVDAWARSRSHPVDGITLRCRPHNQARARMDFGESHMAQFRARPTDPPTAIGEDVLESAAGC